MEADVCDRVLSAKSRLSLGTTGKFRDECPNEHGFVTMDHARRAIETWREEYNAELPHSSLADLAPNEYARRLAETAEQKVSLAADSTCEPD